MLDDDRDRRADRARDAPGQGSRLQRLHRRLRACRADRDDGSREPAARHSIRSRGPRRAATFRLTITKPEGGTIVAAGGILCGVNGSTCSADIPSGVPVSLKAERGGWLRLGAVHRRLPVDWRDGDDVGEDVRRDVHPQRGADQRRPAAVSDSAAGRVQQPAPRPTPVAPPPTSRPPPPATVPTKPAGSPCRHANDDRRPRRPFRTSRRRRPISAEEHAKQEIGQLVKNYCAALGTLKPATVRQPVSPRQRT